MVKRHPQGRNVEARRGIFLAKLEKQILTISDFYQHKRGETDMALAHLPSTLAVQATSSRIEAGSTFVGDSEKPLSGPAGGSRTDERLPLLNSASPYDFEEVRREICDLFVQYHSLKTLISLNSEAVRKVRARNEATILRYLTLFTNVFWIAMATMGN